MPDSTQAVAAIPYVAPHVAPPDRAAIVAEMRARLRADHRRLTDDQLALIADLAAELRLAHIRIEGRAPETDPARDADSTPTDPAR